jgi:DNA-binding GntR family transcriptional regulator
MKKLRKNALSELVYEKIKLMISDGALLPGQKISRKELAETLNVSQTPIMEAINRLAGEGLIEQRNREGLYIKNFTYTELKELFAVRAGMEGVAIRLCVENILNDELDPLLHLFDNFSLPMDEQELKRYSKTDRIFHQRIIEMSGNSIIVNYNRNFDLMIKSFQKGLIRPPEETLAEHRAIIQAIRSRDAHRAQNLLIEHDLKSRDAINKHRLQDIIESESVTQV